MTTNPICACCKLETPLDQMAGDKCGVCAAEFVRKATEVPLPESVPVHDAAGNTIGEAVNFHKNERGDVVADIKIGKISASWQSNDLLASAPSWLLAAGGENYVSSLLAEQAYLRDNFPAYRTEEDLQALREASKFLNESKNTYQAYTSGFGLQTYTGTPVESDTPMNLWQALSLVANHCGAMFGLFAESKQWELNWIRAAQLRKDDGEPVNDNWIDVQLRIRAVRGKE